MSRQRNIFSEFVTGNRQFSWDAYKAARVVKGYDTNILISPLSITASLVLSYYKGSNNETKKQIEKVLRFPQDQDDKLEGIINAAVDALFALKQVTGIKMYIANRVSVPQDKGLQNEYFQSVQADYGIEFLEDSKECRDGIDEWFEEITSGNINDIARHLKFDDGLPSAGSFLASGVYFCGDWKTKFILNEEEEFTVSQSKVVTVPFMSVAGHFKHYKNDYLNFDLLEVLYRGDRLSFLVFLPCDINGLRKLEAELTPQELKSCLSVLAALRLQKMEVSLPRFVLEDATSLKSILSSMGMVSLFSEKDADLSGMAPGLHVTEAAHKVVLDIQPAGHFDSSLYGSVSCNVDVFKANHPFLFAIFDKETDMVVFIGSVTDPTLAT